ncbi:MAG TPA: hypothetical protein VI488_01770 [Candidatus Angelobacter sp.]
MKHWKKLSGLLLLAALLLFPPNGNSCGPFFPDAVFTYQKRPGGPLKWYAEGHLGVLLPSFTPSYLVIGYRYLAGRPLSPGERDQAISYWRWSYQSPFSEGGNQEKDPVQEWLAARKLAVGAETTAKGIPTYERDLAGYGGYENCLADSFHTAALTLTDRARRFGGDRAAVVEWVKGQDMVFSDCSNDKAIPEALPEASPAWLKADRHYQVAAAYFYSRSFDQAAQGYDEIARDSNSPWHGIAPYLAARSMIRKGTLPDTLDKDALHNAEARLTKIMNDPTASNMHDAARRIFTYLALRIRPQERNVELAKSLAGPKPDRDFTQDLIDYAWSLDRLIGDQPVSGTPDFDESQSRLAQARDANEMTDWLMTFQESGPGWLDHAIERWRKLHSLPWLVAALAKVDAMDQAARELLRAAEQVPPASPAYATVLHHRVRLLIQAGENDKARALLQEFLNSPQFTSSSRNLFIAQRMRLPTSYPDFLAYAPRTVVDDDYEDGYFGSCAAKACDELLYGGAVKEKSELRFDRDAALTLNLRLPLELMARAATGEELPEPLRGEVAVAAWTRAVMLERHDLAATLVPEMKKAYPVLREQLDSYLAAKPEEKKHAAWFVILHFPGMRPYVNTGEPRNTKIESIDNYRDNWWCGDMGADVGTMTSGRGEVGSAGSKPAFPRDAPPSPAFLTPEQAKKAGAEWQTLAASGGGGGYLTRQTLAWAKEHPQDPRLAEALHYAVRSTRFGCDAGKVSSLSHKAFTLLHERYPNSKWAKETPYWY